MNNPMIFDELDQAIDQMLAEPNGSDRLNGPDDPEAVQLGARAEISELLDVAGDLRYLPRPDFKMRLKAELEWQSWSPGPNPRLESPSPRSKSLADEAEIMPTLSGGGYGLYPVRRVTFAV